MKLLNKIVMVLRWIAIAYKIIETASPAESVEPDAPPNEPDKKTSKPAKSRSRQSVAQSEKSDSVP